MNHRTSNDSEIGSEGCPSKPISTFADLQVKAYEDRVRERFMAKYPTRSPAEGKRLEKPRNLFRFTLREEFSCRAIDRIASAKISIRGELSKPERLKLQMNENSHQPRVPSLKELYGPKQSSFP